VVFKYFYEVSSRQLLLSFSVGALLSALCSVLLPGLQAADIPGKFTILDLFVGYKFHSFVYRT